jgi:hypothetical protein
VVADPELSISDGRMSRRARWLASGALVVVVAAGVAVVAVVATGDADRGRTESFVAPFDYPGPVWFEIVQPDAARVAVDDVDVTVRVGTSQWQLSVVEGDPLSYWLLKAQNWGGDDNPPLEVTVSEDFDILFGYGDIPIGSASLVQRSISD